MVKRILIVLEDAEHKKLSELKGDRTWKEVVFDGLNVELRLVKKKEM